MSKTLADILANLSANDNANDSEKTLEGLSQAAEAAERYEDMVQIMEALVTRKLDNKAKLTPDQRNLLSVAYKNVVGAKRSSWRMLSDGNQFETVNEGLVLTYKGKVEKELEDTCTAILKILQELAKQNKDRLDVVDNAEENNAEEKNADKECQVFYLKMIGDYYRYLTEAFPTEEYKGLCAQFYGDAMAMAVEALEATHPTRLGLALNYSVCHYEILNQPKEACILAKKAFDDAIEKLDALNDLSYRDSTLIMQLLRDNLTIWNQTDEANQDEDQ